MAGFKDRKGLRTEADRRLDISKLFFFYRSKKGIWKGWQLKQIYLGDFTVVSHSPDVPVGEMNNLALVDLKPYLA